MNEKTVWAGLLTGPFAWFFAMFFDYSVVERFPRGAGHALLHAVYAIAIVLTAIAGVASWRAWQRMRSPGATKAREPQAFMAISGVVTSLFFVLLLVATDLPVFVFNAGD